MEVNVNNNFILFLHYNYCNLLTDYNNMELLRRLQFESDIRFLRDTYSYDQKVDSFIDNCSTDGVCGTIL